MRTLKDPVTVGIERTQLDRARNAYNSLQRVSGGQPFDESDLSNERLVDTLLMEATLDNLDRATRVSADIERERAV